MATLAHSSLVLTEEQEIAEHMVFEYLADRRDDGQHYNAGFAGTGKTTVLAGIARDLPDAILCTLTGKAASVLRYKTGLPATTIHGAFYQLVDSGVDQRGKVRLKFERQHDRGQLANKIVLIDECSMISEEMARDIINTGAKIVAFGDPGQLPPVKGKRFFDNPRFTLRTIHRQALESPIIRQAHSVREGRHYKEDGDAFRVLKRTLSDREILDADVILCNTNITRAALNHQARLVRGYTQPHPMVGEPIMCLKNAAGFGVFNGAVYTLVRDFTEGDTTITLNVDGDPVNIPFVKFAGVTNVLPVVEAVTEFDYGYAMTVHKAQGSEWDSVALIDEYRHRDHPKEWRYTAITRAAKKIVITHFPPDYQPPEPLPF